MRYLWLLPLALLIGCTQTNYDTSDYTTICTTDECKLDKITNYCTSHKGMREFVSIDSDHYYGTCKDGTYVLFYYGDMSTFKVDLSKFD